MQIKLVFERSFWNLQAILSNCVNLLLKQFFFILSYEFVILTYLYRKKFNYVNYIKKYLKLYYKRGKLTKFQSN